MARWAVRCTASHRTARARNRSKPHAGAGSHCRHGMGGNALVHIRSRLRRMAAIASYAGGQKCALTRRSSRRSKARFASFRTRLSSNRPHMIPSESVSVFEELVEAQGSSLLALTPDRALDAVVLFYETQPAASCLAAS